MYYKLRHWASPYYSIKHPRVQNGGLQAEQHVFRAVRVVLQLSEINFGICAVEVSTWLIINFKRIPCLSLLKLSGFWCVEMTVSGKSYRWLIYTLKAFWLIYLFIFISLCYSGLATNQTVGEWFERSSPSLLFQTFLFVENKDVSAASLCKAPLYLCVLWDDSEEAARAQISSQIPLSLAFFFITDATNENM